MDWQKRVLELRMLVGYTITYGKKEERGESTVLFVPYLNLPSSVPRLGGALIVPEQITATNIMYHEGENND